jgi:hypothetical protein
MGLAEVVPVVDPLPYVEDQSAGLTQLDPAAFPMNMGLTLVAFLGCSDLDSVGEPVFDPDYDGEVKSALEYKPCVRVFPAGESKPKPIHPVVALSLVPIPCS